MSGIQNARTQMSVQRNQNLLTNVETNPDFIFSTDTVVARPLLRHSIHLVCLSTSQPSEPILPLRSTPASKDFKNQTDTLLSFPESNNRNYFLNCIIKSFL
jgi:hypothetical protein